MTYEFTIGENEKTVVKLNRNQFTGKFTYSENGIVNLLRSPTDLTTHLPNDRISYYHFAVGNEEKYDIRIVHSWPKLFPAFRPQKYEVLVNGDSFHTIESY